MARSATTKRTAGGKPFSDYIAALIDGSEMTQIQLAREIGYDNPNIVSMFKKGITKVPVDKLPLLAAALHVDPAHLTRMALREYYPDLFAALESVFGHAVTANEFDIVKRIRKITKDANPRFEDERHKELERLFR